MLKSKVVAFPACTNAEDMKLLLVSMLWSTALMIVVTVPILSLKTFLEGFSSTVRAIRENFVFFIMIWILVTVMAIIITVMDRLVKSSANKPKR